MKEKTYGLTDAQVEAEIERLRNSEVVALARRKQRLEYRRRQFLYQLRDLEKKGKALLVCSSKDCKFSKEYVSEDKKENDNE